MSRARRTQFVISVVVAVCGCLITRDKQGQESQSPRIAVNEAALRDGDVILLRTSSVRGLFVRVTDNAGDFTHAGIVRRRGGVVDVVHADPERGLDGNRAVRRVSLAAFANDARASDVAVFRLRDERNGAARAAAEWAGVQAQKAVPFDEHFNLEDSTALYCTELLWRAFGHAGIRVAVTERRPFRLQSARESVVLVSAFEQRTELVRVR